MIKELKLTRRRKLLGAVVICVVLITGSTMLWQMSQVAEAAILDPHPGLVGWWRLDEEVGSVAEDSSGNGNDGSVYGATSVDGKYGEALSFDGVDDYIKVLDKPLLHITENVTLEAWIKRDATQLDDNGIIVMKDWNYLLQVSKTGLVQWVYRNVDGEWQTVASIGTVDEGWHHIAGTRTVENGNLHLYLYIDGILNNGGLKSKLASDSNAPVQVGRWTATAYRYKGVIDEVRIYNRTLSASEIEKLFQKGPDFSSRFLAKVPKGTTQFMATVSWQGIGTIGITIEAPSKIYTEDVMSVYQKTDYLSSSNVSVMLNIKRVSVSMNALLSDENWYVLLEFNNVEDYKMSVEIIR